LVWRVAPASCNDRWIGRVNQEIPNDVLLAALWLVSNYCGLLFLSEKRREGEKKIREGEREREKEIRRRFSEKKATRQRHRNVCLYATERLSGGGAERSGTVDLLVHGRDCPAVDDETAVAALHTKKRNEKLNQLLCIVDRCDGNDAIMKARRPEGAADEQRFE